jgi:CBS-domain-containing membrane protein
VRHRQPAQHHVLQPAAAGGRRAQLSGAETADLKHCQLTLPICPALWGDCQCNIMRAPYDAHDVLNLAMAASPSAGQPA